MLMKHILTILLISFAATQSPAHAQLLSEWGIKGGITVSNQNWKFSVPDIDRETDNYVGLNLDLFGTIIEKNAFSAIGELSYVQKGTSLEIVPTFVDPSGHGYIDLDPIRFKDRFDYVSLSLYGKIKQRFWRLSPYVFIGPRIDLLVDESVETIPRSTYEKFEKLNWGVSLGLGSEIETFLPFRILVGFQYSPDFSHLYEHGYLSIRKYSYEIELGVIF